MPYMDTTLLPRSSWKMAGRRNSLGRIYGSLVRGFSCKEVKVAWASCRRYSSELLRSSRFCSSLSTAFSPPSQMETVALLVSVNGVHNCSAWLRFSGVQAAFQNHDFYFISVFQVFYFDFDELSQILIITLQRNSALYMYAKCIFH